MSMPQDADPTAEPSPPKWQPLEAVDRRLLGVLVEKAKTTPDAYPLSLNGLKSGANQKSNRFPQMTLDDDQIAESLDRLRTAGAVMVIQGDGRVEKYRHLAYDWLGVDKVELAVMAELLLRGAQTIGELRGRAARMEPIPGMSDLGPILASLQTKSLVVYLTPPGRGAVVTHNLYQPREMDKVRREHGVTLPADEHPVPQASAPVVAPSVVPPPAPAMRVAVEEFPAQLAALQKEVASLRTSLAAYRDEAETKIEKLRDDLDRLLH